MERPDWVPDNVDLSLPSVARAYDYMLGGAHNFAIDRDFARQFLAVLPEGRLIARVNRGFLHRAVRFMVDQGIRQFLDIGSGIPTVGNVHEIAQEIAPDTRVVYVDIDAVAVAHSQQILVGNERATAIQEDLRRPDAILKHSGTRALLDFDQPVGLILAAVLGAIPDEDHPSVHVARFREALCPGSYVAISHSTYEIRPDETLEAARLTGQTDTPAALRTYDEIMTFFTGLELVEPGLVWVQQWRPDLPTDVGDNPALLSTYGGVGRKG